MLVWETDPSMRGVRRAIPKVVFSRSLDSIQGNARLAEASVAEEIAVDELRSYAPARDQSH